MVPETVLMIEQLDEGPFMARRVKYFTAKRSMFVAGLNICSERLAKSCE